MFIQDSFYNKPVGQLLSVVGLLTEQGEDNQEPSHFLRALHLENFLFRSVHRRSLLDGRSQAGRSNKPKCSYTFVIIKLNYLFSLWLILSITFAYHASPYNTFTQHTRELNPRQLLWWYIMLKHFNLDWIQHKCNYPIFTPTGGAGILLVRGC